MTTKEALNGLSRRERERLSRRATMLNAAKVVFAERGYVGATLEEIANRAEFGKGTLYNYFPGGKEEILLAIFDQLYDGLYDLIENSFRNANGRPFRDVMHAFIASSFAFFFERFNLFMILVKEAERLIFSDKEKSVAYFDRQQERVLAALAAPLKDAMDRGEIRPMPPHFLAHMLFVNIKGCQMRHCPRQRTASIAPAVESPDRLAELLTDLVLYGASLPEPADTA